MPESDVRNTIRKFIEERFMIGRPSNMIKDTDSLLEKGIIDSTGVLELVSFLEENYGITVEDEDLVPENLGAVSNIVSYVQRRAGITT